MNIIIINLLKNVNNTYGKKERKQFAVKKIGKKENNKTNNSIARNIYNRLYTNINIK